MLSSRVNNLLLSVSRTCQYVSTSCTCNCKWQYVCGTEGNSSVVAQKCVRMPRGQSFLRKFFSPRDTSASFRDVGNILSRVRSSASFLPAVTRCCSIRKTNPGQKLGEPRTISHYVAGMRRLEALKENDELCAEALKSGRFAVFYNLRPFFSADDESGRMKLVWKNASEMEKILDRCEGLKLSDAVLLNSTSRDPSAPARFTLHVPEGGDGMQESLETALQAQALGIRRAMFGTAREDVPDLLQAHAILQWHSLQAFCSKCGGKNEKNASGSRRVCASCSGVHYPTMKPVVITLVINGERCLVARQPQFPDGMYSALAGFCDMGETLEDAVRREVAEEVGLEVESISYSSSQHWPLPTSGLMLGCYATVKAGSDAEIQSILESKGQSSLWLPPRQAIAHHLLRGWAFQS